MLESVCLNIAFANISREDQASDSYAKSGYILGICLIFKIISKISYTKSEYDQMFMKFTAKKTHISFDILF